MADNTKVLEQMLMSLRGFIASQSVHEVVMVHLVTQLATFSDNPSDFKRSFIEGVGQTLRDDLERGELAGFPTENDTLEYFESFRSLFTDDDEEDMLQ